MIPSSPIIIEGKKYPEYAVFLSSAPIVSEDTYRTAVNLTLVPMRTNEEGKVELAQDNSKNVLFSDIVKSGDIKALTAFGKINAAVQEFINEKQL